MIGMQAAGAEIMGPVEPALAAPAMAVLLAACGASAAVVVRIAARLRRGLPVVADRPHPPATWTAGDVALVALAYVGLVAIAGTLVSPRSPLRLQLAADVATKVSATLVGIGVLRAAGASWAAIGFVGGRWREDLAVAAAGLALVLGPLLGIAAALDRIVPYEHPIVAFLQQGRDPWAVGLVVLAAVVVAPLAEEFFFRRALQGWLETRLPAADGAGAIGLQAAVFAAAHLGHGLAAVPLFLLGLVLGVIARATGALGPCVLLHALFNAVSVGLLLADPAAGAG